MAKASHSCTNCGAALAIPEQHDRYFTCRFCGSVLEDTTPPDQQGTGEIQLRIAQLTSFDASQLVSYAAPVARTAGKAVLIFVVVLLAGVGAAIFAIVRVVGDASTTRSAPTATADGTEIEIFNYAAASVVGSDNGTGGDVVAVSRGPDGDRVVYVDLDADRQFRWSVDLGFDADVFTKVVDAGDLVVLSTGDTLVALNRATGDEAWRAVLSDVHQPNICVSCFSRFGDAIVTLAADGVLSAHATSSGEQLWSSTLNDTPRQVVDFGGNPAVLDTGGDGQVALQVVDVSSGSITRSLPMSCPDPTFGGRDSIGIFDRLFPLDGGVVQFGDRAFAPCIQRWDRPGDGPTWETAFASGEGPDPDPDEVMIAGGTIITTSDGQVATIDPATGAVAVVATIDEGNVFPIAADDAVVVVAVESTRGSGSHQLRAIDRGTGNVKWTFDLESTERFVSDGVGFTSGDGWSADLTSGGLSVLQYRSDDDQIVLQTIPLESGTATTPSTLDIGGLGFSASLSIIGWNGDRLHLLVDGTVLEVDALTGDIALQAP